MRNFLRMGAAIAALSMSAVTALAEGELNIFNWGNYTSPEMIKKELLMHAIAYNAIRSLIRIRHSQHRDRCVCQGRNPAGAVVLGDVRFCAAQVWRPWHAGV